MGCTERREKIYKWMETEKISLVMLRDAEGGRDSAVRWLSGQPGDALLFLSADRKSLLVPWDVNLARIYADADYMTPYADCGLDAVTALAAAADFLKVSAGGKIEIPAATSYPDFLNYVDKIQEFNIICRRDGLKAEIEALRAVKDAEEVAVYRELSAITNCVIGAVTDGVRDGGLLTETDAALFIEAEARKRGCEGTGFTTLAAGAERSFGIHAFPPFSAAPFAGPGLSILDFGLVYRGYTSDVTMTFARGPLSKKQEKMLALVEEAFGLAVSKVKDGASCRAIAQAVDTLFRRTRLSMPHGLGHGIGLDAHEAPYLRSRGGEGEWRLAPGMIFTVEPGLYDPVEGGCRLENDVLLTEKGAELLTRSGIVRL
jgi:Xaa-Pro dipeptidase